MSPTTSKCKLSILTSGYHLLSHRKRLFVTTTAESTTLFKPHRVIQSLRTRALILTAKKHHISFRRIFVIVNCRYWGVDDRPHLVCDLQIQRLPSADIYTPLNPHCANSIGFDIRCLPILHVHFNAHPRPNLSIYPLINVHFETDALCT